jgi:pimeloyl-ACP methyl ester carboxylesterase
MRIFSIACAAAASALSLLAPLLHAQPTKACHVSGIRTEVQCGIVQRPLDPANPTGAKIDVHFVVVPATARNKRDDALFFFAGGPGQGAMKVAPQMTAVFARFNNWRDLVFIDQRGTGKTASLHCDFEEKKFTLTDMIDPNALYARLEKCKATLQAKPHGDLRHYTTMIAMQDVDAVREALGYPRINIIGASYGTRAVLEYQRAFPQRVRRAVMDGVAPPDMVLPSTVSADSYAALDAVFKACEADAACKGRYPNLRGTWQALLAGLPKTVSLAHPNTGKFEPVTITRDTVAGALRTPLYVPSLASAVPEAITQAAAGDFGPMLGISNALASGVTGEMSMGMHLSVVCAEDYPRMATTLEKPNAEMGDQFASLYLKICPTWPRNPVPEAFYAIPETKHPVLMLSGGSDPVTPPRHAERTAKALGPNAKHIVVQNAGHGVFSMGCMRDVIYKFFDAKTDAEAQALDAGCATAIPRPPAFLPPQIAQGAKP